jgi:hypothetical protein
MVSLVFQEIPALLVPMALMDNPANRELTAHLDRLVLQVQLDLLDPRVMSVVLANRV